MSLLSQPTSSLTPLTSPLLLRLLQPNPHSLGLITASIVAGILEFNAEDLGLDIVSPLAPAVMVFFGAYCVATLFFIIFSSIIGTTVV